MKKNNKRLKTLTKIIIIIVIIMLIEVLYVGYSVLFNNKESLYFDGINAIVLNKSSYITVGSNNNNDKKYEKAKLSTYNDKYEKDFEKLYNIGYNSAFFGVCTDEDNIIAVGSYEKNKTDHKNSIRRALIVKYDKDGEILFEKDFKLLDNSKFTSVVSLEDGYLVTGQSIYKNTKVGDGVGGAILIKYDKDGNIIWKRNYGSSKSAVYNDLLVLDNNIYTVGMDENNLGIIVKYDMDGNLITYNDYKSTDDLGFSGIINLDDKIYISGSNHSKNDHTNAMIVEYDLDCNYEKQIIYEEKGITRYNKLAKDSHDNIIAIGIKTTTKKSKNKSADVLNYDGIIGKYNKNLEEVTVEVYGEERDDYFTDILVVDNTYLVVGYSSYEDGSYLSKFIRYSDALKILGVE